MRVPATYGAVERGRVRVAIRRDLMPVLGPWLIAPALVLPAAAERLSAGRGAAYRVVLENGLGVVLRLYRRGGLAAHLSLGSYLGFRPRPLRELALTVEARRRGVAAAEVLAARVEGGFRYRGAVVTAEVAGAATLLEALRHAPSAAARRELATATGRAVAALHAAGVVHPDLNLTNILTRPGPAGAEIVLIDFDRARLRSAPLGRSTRRRMLRRLERSCARLDPERTVTGADERQAFRAAYAGGTPDGFQGGPADRSGLRCAC